MIPYVLFGRFLYSIFVPAQNIEGIEFFFVIFITEIVVMIPISFVLFFYLSINIKGKKVRA